MRYANIPESHAAHEAFGLPVPAEVSTYPAPTITSRDGAEVPDLGPVKALCALAQSRNWYWDRQYAEGVYPHAATGLPGSGPKRSIKVRLSSPQGLQSAVAVFVSPVTRAQWSWDFIWLWSAEGMTKLHGITQLQDHLELWETSWHSPKMVRWAPYWHPPLMASGAPIVARTWHPPRYWWTMPKHPAAWHPPMAVPPVLA